MKSNRTPVMADVVYSLQWFLAVLAVCAIISDMSTGDAFSFCTRALPCAAAFVLSALIVRLSRSAILRAAIPALAAAGCIFLGRTAGECIALALVGFAAIVCGFFIHFNMKKGVTQYGGMFVIAVILALLPVAAEYAGWDTAQPWLSVISAVYLPLCVAIWYLGRLTGALAVFSRRADQPIELINKRMYSTVITTVVLVLLAAMLIPQAGGGSLLSVVLNAMLRVAVWIVVFIAKLLPVFYPSDPEFPEEIEESVPVFDNTGGGSLIGIYIMYFAAAALFIFIFGWLIASAAKLIKKIVSDYLTQGELGAELAISETDTVEKIDRTLNSGSDRREGRTNAGKIRRIYKKKISAILDVKDSTLSSLTPDEIAALCAEKGENIAALTLLYKKARYTNSCTADDLKAARRL